MVPYSVPGLLTVDLFLRAGLYAFSKFVHGRDLSVDLTNRNCCNNIPLWSQVDLISVHAKISLQNANLYPIRAGDYSRLSRILLQKIQLISNRCYLFVECFILSSFFFKLFYNAKNDFFLVVEFLGVPPFCYCVNSISSLYSMKKVTSKFNTRSTGFPLGSNWTSEIFGLPVVHRLFLLPWSTNVGK